MLVWRQYQKNAELRKVPFELDLETFTLVATGSCTFCGIKPDRVRTYSGARVHQTTKDFGVFVYNGIDRLDSSRGYTADNVTSCCWDCNRAKGKLSTQEFDSWIERLVKFRSSYVSNCQTTSLVSAPFELEMTKDVPATMVP